MKDVDPNSPTGRRVIADLKSKLDTNDRDDAISFGKKYGIFKNVPVKPAFKKDGGLAEAIEKVKAKEMKDGGGVKMGPKIPAKIKDPVKVKPIPKKIAKKLVGFEKGGEAVPSRFKGFSKLPEEVQKKMDPALAERFEDGGAVKMGSGGGVCKGMGIARAGGKFKVR